MAWLSPSARRPVLRYRSGDGLGAIDEAGGARLVDMPINEPVDGIAGRPKERGRPPKSICGRFVGVSGGELGDDLERPWLWANDRALVLGAASCGVEVKA